MNHVEAEIAYREVADDVVALYETAVEKYPEDKELVVFLALTSDEGMGVIPLKEFRTIASAMAPALLPTLDEGCEAGAFWFVIVYGQQVFLRVVHPETHRAEKPS